MKSFIVVKENSTSLIYVAASALLGLLLLIFPETATGALMWILAAALIICGAVRVYQYFKLSKKEALLGDRMVSGLILIAVGLIVGLAQRAIAGMFPFVFGCALLLGGIIKFQGAFDLRIVGYKRWYIALLAALLSGALGLVILLNPFATALTLMRVLGAFLLIEAVQDAIYTLRYNTLKKRYFVY